MNCVSLKKKLDKHYELHFSNLWIWNTIRTYVMELLWEFKAEYRYSVRPSAQHIVSTK